MKVRDGEIEVNSQVEHVLFSKGRTNKNVSTDECFYCRRHGDITLNCKICPRDLEKGIIKKPSYIANYEDPRDDVFEESLDSGSDNEFKAEFVTLFKLVVLIVCGVTRTHHWFNFFYSLL